MFVSGASKVLSLGLAIALLSSCAKHANISKNCAVTEDQKGSFMPRVNGFPIQITADDQFNSQERDAIAASIREWNREGRSVSGIDLFTVRFAQVPSGIRSLDPHQCGSDMGGDRDFYVVREQNQSHWNSIGFQESTPGATIRCYSGDRVERQIVYMNPSLMNASQFDQAFSHEFGHALGLDHSCNSKTGLADYIGCQSLQGGTAHPYAQAVMFPMLKPGAISFSNSGANSIDSSNRVSSVLKENDRTRAECITGPTD